MTHFELHAQLVKDCHRLGRLPLCEVLLHRNAAVPWFILVPQTDATEMIDLSAADQATLLQEINQLAQFVRDGFPVTKLNIAAIGNIVQQLHVHIVGRHEQDYCWPDVIWGTSSDIRYDDAQVQTVIGDLGRQVTAFTTAGQAST